jgi:hypothetical protein
MRYSVFAEISLTPCFSWVFDERIMTQPLQRFSRTDSVLTPNGIDTHAIKGRTKGGKKGRMKTGAKWYWVRGNARLSGPTQKSRLRRHKLSVQNRFDQLRLNSAKSGQKKIKKPNGAGVSLVPRKSFVPIRTQSCGGAELRIPKICVHLRFRFYENKNYQTNPFQISILIDHQCLTPISIRFA